MQLQEMFSAPSGKPGAKNIQLPLIQLDLDFTDLKDVHTAVLPNRTAEPRHLADPPGVALLEESSSSIGSVDSRESVLSDWDLELDKVQEILSGSSSKGPVPARKPRMGRWFALAGCAAVAGLGVTSILVSRQDADDPSSAPAQSIAAVPLPSREAVPTAAPRNFFRATVPVLQDDAKIPSFPAAESAEPRTTKLEDVKESAVEDGEGRWSNSLGMRFVAIGNVKFSVWETRVQDYEAFCAATGRERQRALYEESGMHPVTMVDWQDAKAFCDWLTKTELAEGVLAEGQHYRLPTDLEWSQAAGLSGEKGASPAARDSAIEGQYPWGAAWPPPVGTGNFGDDLQGYNDGFVQTAPVGSFPGNPFGLYDMAGNVWEWCEDTYSSRNAKRVTRGGSWTSNSREELASSSRNPVSPERRGLIYGFRCVLAE